MTPSFVSFGNIFIDDIVLPDGRTFMATPGGAGLHALIGMRVWSEELGLVAFAGHDFPEKFRLSMEQFGVDLQGVLLKDGAKTTRAWQLFEPDSRRIEIFRTDKADFFKFAPDYADIPRDYYLARGFHLYWAKEVAEFSHFAQQLREVSQRAKFVWEPAFHHSTASPADLRRALSHVDLFSPDELAAYTMTNTNVPEDALNTFLEWGAQAVAIRMGAVGSLLGTVAGDRWQLPAVPVSVIDQTGAGNAFCGGFVVGLVHEPDILEAALSAVVSASFAIEQFGIPQFDREFKEKRAKRREWARVHVEKLK